jgi:hypothetical protein
MPFDIDIAPSVASLLEVLSPRTRRTAYMRLGQVADAAERWPQGDLRWEQLAHREGADLYLYVEGCCLRLQLQPLVRRLVVRELGRVLVRLPAEATVEGPEALSGISC